MWIDTPVFHEDMEAISAVDFIPWNQFREKTFFITGGTGLIGSTLISALLYANTKKSLNCRVVALVRDLQKAKEKFAAQLRETENFSFVQGSVENLPVIYEDIDYIVHGASQTASKAFVEHPIETIQTAVYGTDNVLQLAYKKKVQGMAYLSSMEVYGHPPRGHKVTEDETGSFSPMNVRNSYPISKLMCENLCCAYAKEYGVPVSIVRLTQTFGPGVQDSDRRIFAEFGRCIKEKRDIVLKTKGETERSYLYTADAVTAILCILLKGTPGMAYNAADETTYCSIAQMAQKVAEWGGINVQFEIQDEVNLGYPKPLYMDLFVEKLKNLGWIPTGGGTVDGTKECQGHR